MKKKILSGILVLLIAIQFIRPEKNEGSADSEKDITHVVKVPDHILTMLKASCYDCHSNHTQYYWYHAIMPVGWWLNHHVEDGKKHLNFSEFSTYNAKKIDHKLEETAEEVEEHEMPLKSYTLVHKEASLSDEQIKTLVEWVKTERRKIDVTKL